MSNLTKYVDQLNFLRKIQKRLPLAVNSPKDRKIIRDNLECDLSPENLCCDGELFGPALRAKSKMLYGAMDELDARDAK